MVFDGARRHTTLFTLSGPEAGEFGHAIAGGGDLDGNGLADLVVGLPLADLAAPVPRLDAGAVRVFGMSSVVAPWVELGGGLAGQAGLPTLHGVGVPAPDEPVTLVLGQAAPSSTFVLIIGSSATNQPFKGGVLGPAPDVVLGGFSTNGAGSASLEGRWPSAWPAGLELFLQAWISDASGPQGVTASNVLQVTLP